MPCLQQTLCLLLRLLEFFIQALDAQLITQVKTKTNSTILRVTYFMKSQVLCDLLKSQMSDFIVWPLNVEIPNYFSSLIAFLVF